MGTKGDQGLDCSPALMPDEEWLAIPFVAATVDAAVATVSSSGFTNAAMVVSCFSRERKGGYMSLF
jgi:hypothetical protein